MISKLFFAPPQAGGDREKAIQRWQEAIKLAEQEQPKKDSLLPDWGKAELPA